MKITSVYNVFPMIVGRGDKYELVFMDFMNAKCFSDVSGEIQELDASHTKEIMSISSRKKSVKPTGLNVEEQMDIIRSSMPVVEDLKQKAYAASVDAKKKVDEEEAKLREEAKEEEEDA